MVWVWFALGVGIFFAMNIGGSGAASAMGAAYGSRVIGNLTSRVLVGVFACAGAVLAGETVVQTIGHGLVPDGTFSVGVVVIVLSAAVGTLALANWAGVPLSTSEVAVGAVVGAGLATGHVFVGAVLRVLGAWALLPLFSLALSYVLGRWAFAGCNNILKRTGRWGRRFTCVAVVAAGCYQAFAAGMNNVANALGPLVAAGIVDGRLGLWLGGLALGIGAILLGRRVLQTNGRDLVDLGLIGATFVTATSGTLVVLASLAGIPVPMTQTTGVAIMGFGWGLPHGRVNRTTAVKVLRVWVISPLLSMSITYLCVDAFINSWSLTDVPGAVVMLSLGLTCLVLMIREMLRRTGVAETVAE